MERLRIADFELLRPAFVREILRSKDSRYDQRLHAILLVGQGVDCCQVAEWFAVDSRTIQRWVKRFQAEGFAGLRGGKHPGRRRRLDDMQWEALRRDLRANPHELGYGQNLWSVKLLSLHLLNVYGISLGIRQCYRIFQNLRLRLHARSSRKVSSLGG